MFFRRVFGRKSDEEVASNMSFQRNRAVTRTPSAMGSARSAATTSVLQLTPLWEHVVRFGKLPPNLDPWEIFSELIERLRDPEWQVRQHALRVVVDLIPALGTDSDKNVSRIVPYLVSNLGHAAPAVRRGALDALSAHLHHSADPASSFRRILESDVKKDFKFGRKLKYNHNDSVTSTNSEDDNSSVDDRNHVELDDSSLGLMLALPALVHPHLSGSNPPVDESVVKQAIAALDARLGAPGQQEIALRVLAKLKDELGDRKFQRHLSSCRSDSRRDFDLLSQVYGISTNNINNNSGFTSATQILDKHLTKPSNINNNTHSDIQAQNHVMQKNVPKSVITNIIDEEINENKSSVQEKSTESIKPEEDESIQIDPETGLPIGRVIMETEIMLDEDTSVTMTIHEQDDELIKEQELTKNDVENEDNHQTLKVEQNSNNHQPGSKPTLDEESERDDSDGGSKGVMRIFTDSDEDGSLDRHPGNYYNSTSGISTTVIPPGSPTDDTESSRRTPRRVRFGGEVVKMRTPDSDALHSSDQDDSYSKKKEKEAHEVQSSEADRENSARTNGKEEKPATSVRNMSHSRSHIPLPTRNAGKFIDVPRKKVEEEQRPAPASFPVTGHHEVEVLHNLQRSPMTSPRKDHVKRNGANSNQHDDHNGSDIFDNDDLEEELFVHVAPTDEPDTGTGSSSGSDRYKSDCDWEDLGLVDPMVIADLNNRSDWRRRMRGCEALASALSSPTQLQRVLPRLPSLLRRLLSVERHPRAADSQRQLLRQLLGQLPKDILRDRLPQLASGLCRRGGASGASATATLLMRRLSVAEVIDALLGEDFTAVRSAKTRERRLQTVLYSLLTFPARELASPGAVARRVATLAVNEDRRRVRQAALDTLAALGHAAGAPAVLRAVRESVRGHRDAEVLFEAVKARLSRKQLPRIGADGSVAYALRLGPARATTASGADVDWLLAGAGPASAGTVQDRYCTEPPLRPKLSTSLPALYQNQPNRTAAPPWSYRKVPNQDLVAIGVGVRPLADDNVTWTLVPVKRSATVENVNKDDFIERESESPMQNKIKFLQNKKRCGKDFENPKTDGSTISARAPDMSRPVLLKLQAHTHNVDKHQNTGSTISRIPLITSTHNQRSSGFMISSNGRKNNSPGTPVWNRSPLDESRSLINDDFVGGPLAYHPTPNQMTNTYERLQNGKSVALTPHHVVPSPSTEDVLQAHVDIQKRQQELLFQLQQKQALLDRVSYGRDTPTNFSNAEIDGPRFVQRNVSSAPGNQREILDQIRTDTQDQNGSLPHISRPASTQTVKSYLQNKNEESTIMEAPNSLANGHGDSSISKSPEKFQKDSPVFSAMAAVSAAYPDYKTPRSLLNDKTEMHSRSPTPNNSRPITPSSIKESPYQTPERKIPKPTQIVRQNDDYVVQIETNGAQAATMRSKSRQEGSATPIRTPSPNQNGSLPPTPKRKINKSVPTTPKSTGSSRAATPQRYADSPKSIASRAVSYQGSPAKKDDSGYISSSKTRDDDVPFVVKVHPKRFTDGDSNVYDEPPSDTSIYANPSSTAEDTHRENFPCLVKKQSYLMRSRKEQEVKPPQRRLSRATSKLNSSYGASTNRNSANNLITPFDNVKEGLSRTIRDLECNDWEKNVSAFKGLIRLLRYHNDVVESSLHPLSVLMAKHILNLRSQVSRAACQAAGELFAIPRRGLDAELDDITQPLLHRTADTNRFLRADADAALDIMCDRLAPHKVVFVATGKSASHASALVRGTCARLLSRLVHRVGRDKIFSLNKDYRDRVLTTGAKFLQEGSLETRNYAKQIFQELNKHDNFSRTIVEVLPSRTMRNIEKTLRSIH